MSTLFTAMAFSFLPELLTSTLIVCVVLALYFRSKRSNSPLRPIDWPIVGVLPAIVFNLQNIHEYITYVLLSFGHSYKVSTISLSFFFTCDPANVRHIFTSNHANYPKGQGFAEAFDVMRGSFFTVDGELWRRQREKIQSILSNPQILSFTANCCRNKIEQDLVPFLIHMARTTTLFDMNDLMSRVAFDVTAMPIFGTDPCQLSSHMPSVEVSVAMDTVMEVAFFRQIVPECCWKVMRRLKVGREGKLVTAHTVLRKFIKEMVERRKSGCVDGLSPCEAHNLHGRLEKQATNNEQVDILSQYLNDPYYNEDLLCAKLITYMVAGRDTISTTLSWIFYNLSRNPHVLSVIRNELLPIVSSKTSSSCNQGTIIIFNPDETKALVYLNVVLLETLRLYPPTPLERKTVASSDVMPSGHKVHEGEIVIISLYAMGRMKDIWGEDCQDFRPERWLLEDGSKLRYVPSHKFLAFNSGPRMCLGKDIAIMQMKTIMATILWNFDVEVLEGHAVKQKNSALLQMKNGLMVKVKEREIYV
uniref:Uncharacterized protein n=1 Tax=Avena sativa TaxID=4498 RepID=A0ACD6AKC7_AVESA